MKPILELDGLSFSVAAEAPSGQMLCPRSQSSLAAELGANAGLASCTTLLDARDSLNSFASTLHTPGAMAWI